MTLENKTAEFRPATLDDLPGLLKLEAFCFETDRLSKRSFRHWIQSEHADLLLCQEQGQVIAYGLSWCKRGTRLARLYSLAVHPDFRAHGLAWQALAQLEKKAKRRGYIYMRLEVAKKNTGAIALYQRNGYQVFGEYSDYYDDHSDALRMQKTIRTLETNQSARLTPWYRQTTPFTCGPSALMMAMASLNENAHASQAEELQLWREATTIYMTSGHGGCHPFGLALAAAKRGFQTEVLINTQEALFVSGVRSSAKKTVMQLVHDEFLKASESEQNLSLTYRDMSAEWLEEKFNQGFAILVLISTYQLDRRKAPHWVVITQVDSDCFYVHDPDFSEEHQRAIDYQHIPIAKADFGRMASYGSERLKTAVLLRKV